MTVTMLHVKALAPGDRTMVDARTWTVQAVDHFAGLVALELVDRNQTPGSADHGTSPGITAIYNALDLVAVERSQAPAH
jgi:hypothetical protein